VHLPSLEQNYARLAVRGTRFRDILAMQKALKIISVFAGHYLMSLKTLGPIFKSLRKTLTFDRHAKDPPTQETIP
jgi:hypothetical protein